MDPKRNPIPVSVEAAFDLAELHEVGVTTPIASLGHARYEHPNYGPVEAEQMAEVIIGAYPYLIGKPIDSYSDALVAVISKFHPEPVWAVCAGPNSIALRSPTEGAQRPSGIAPSAAELRSDLVRAEGKRFGVAWKARCAVALYSLPSDEEIEMVVTREEMASELSRYRGQLQTALATGYGDMALKLSQDILRFVEEAA